MSEIRRDVVDFHSHILPLADHGSDSVETSLFQLSEASLHAVSRIVATPHFYPHRHTLEKFLSRRERAYSMLATELSSDVPEIRLGAEVLVCEGLENFEGLESLCIEGTRTLLLELPFSEFREAYSDTVKKIIGLGYDVLLAHVDRYPARDIEKLIDVGVKHLQINAESIDKLFKPKHILKWVREGLVVALGSDIHGRDKKAYRHFERARQIISESVDSFINYSNEIWI